MTIDSLVSARFGMFVHFGLYSMMGRGEWVMNREAISPKAMRELAQEFNPRGFNAEEIADLAVSAGMRYVVFTTMHHDGFRMYETALSDFSSVAICGRDFVKEMIEAARSRGLGIGLYHSLNNWYDQPDAVSALEDPDNYEVFIRRTHERISELVTRYSPFDILWYDGWWPFNAEGWRAEAMNAAVRGIAPHILFNGRNGLAGDFATPEQHLKAPEPWRPWEACITLNESWGFHGGDHSWKTPHEVIRCLATVAQSRGNLLLNIGPDGDGRVPEPSKAILHDVGDWLKRNGESIFDTDFWTLDPHQRGKHRGDWGHHGRFTAKGNTLYLIATSLPEVHLTLTGLEMKVLSVEVLGEGEIPFVQEGGALRVDLQGASCGASKPALYPLVFKMKCDRPPVLYKTGGMRTPCVDHPRYDPIASDIAW